MEEFSEEPRVLLKRAQKKLKQIASLEEKAAEGATLSSDQLGKVARKADFENDIAQAEAAILMEETAAATALEDRKIGMANVTKVEFDTDKYGCSICCDVLDAATTMRPCNHTFCRECIEEALRKMIDANMTVPQRIKAVICPLCRTQLWNKAEGKVVTAPATHLRKRLAKASGKCHCGELMPLGTLREHLRQCGRGTALHGERKNFSNEFEQPPVLEAPERDGWQWTGREYDEDSALQAALAESCRGAVPPP